MMEATKIKEILKTEYGFENEEQFNSAWKGFKGIDIGIFVNDLVGRSKDEIRKEKIAI